MRLGLVEVDLGEADGVGARLLGQVVHQRGRLLQDRPGDRPGVLGGEGGGAHLDDAGVVLVAHVHHPAPVREQILDRGVLAEREDPVVGLAVVDARAGRSRASIAATISWLRMYSKRMSGSDGAAAAADAGDGAEEPRRRRAGLLRADREGHVGMVLVLGAEVEIADRGRERQQHEEEEAGQRRVVAGPEDGARRRRDAVPAGPARAGAGLGLGLAGAPSARACAGSAGAAAVAGARRRPSRPP